MTKVERLEQVVARLQELSDQCKDKQEELDVYSGVLAEMLIDIEQVQKEFTQEWVQAAAVLGNRQEIPAS